MNQILITKKLYITPELKKKKKIYKFYFVLSIFILIILISATLYTEYGKNKSEEVSQEILANMDISQDSTTAKNNMLIVVLDDEEQNAAIQEEIAQELSNNANNGNATNNTIRTKEGFGYKTIATVSIPKIDVKYAILEGETGSEQETEELLKMSPIKFWGPDPNEVGNFSIVGHNYRNAKFFSKVPTLENGDIIEITDLSGKTIKYRVYNKYNVDPTDVSCTSQLTSGRKEVTLITCTDDSKLRVVVKAREIR